jgi:hypothetical protein
MRTHPGSVNLRYLAPPLALLGVAAGAIAAIVGLSLSTPAALAGLTLPAGYLALVLAGSLVVGRELGWRAKGFLPVVLITMHMSWGAGFLSSVRSTTAG